MEINDNREPRIIFPTQILEQNYVGELFGYFVANTNTYNVLPIDDEANINHNKIYSIGYILPVNPFSFVDAEIESQIKYLKNVENSPSEMVRKMQESLLNQKTEKAQKYYDYENLPTKLVIAGIKSCREFDGNNNHSAIQWIKNVLIPQLYLHPDELANTECPVVGYWEKGQLYFVQLSTRKECKQDKYSLKLDVFSRNTGILESDIMLEKGALFIGCGSVGSFFALELAKAGVGRFLLIDNDIFGYHNICRHQCGIYDVGRYKTDALKERILQINPYAKVVTKNTIIQDVPVAELVEFCDKNTIVIGGADNREGDLYANGLAQQIEMPFMSIGCWERAFAGEIFYCLPRNMPNYQDFVEVTGVLSARVTQNRRFYTTEEELAKITFEPGISADINFVTIIAVKLALDILNIGNEKYTQRLLPHLTQYTLVCNTNSTKIGGESAEIFSYPLQVTTSITVPYSKK